MSSTMGHHAKSAEQTRKAKKLELAYLDNVTLANPQLREGRIAWAEAPSSLWEDPEFSETVRRNLPWHRATS
jgi:hypothetical protein